VIRDALRETGKVGIGQLAIGGRERLCSLKPCGSGILLETLRYEDEVRESDPYFEDVAKARVADEELDLAKELIKRKSTRFDASKFHDHYREALKELIDAKAEHRPPRPVEEERPTAKVVNLMDALRESLKASRPAEERPRPRLSRRRKAG
jgi:DNA end-binding protein Ku